MTRLSRYARVIPIALLIAGTMVGLSPSPAYAATILVTTTADQLDIPTPNSQCSLREAVHSAELDTAIGGCTAGAAGADLIVLGALTYVLSVPGPSEQASATGDLDLAGSLTIRGDGARKTRVVGSATFGDRPFQVESGATVGILGVSVGNGDSADGWGGGGIFNQGTLTLADVVVTGNESNVGSGGIRNDGMLTYTGGTVSNNVSFQAGGGINSSGTLALTNVTLSGNETGAGAGGIENSGGTVTLDHVTVSNNTADVDNGGGGPFGGGIAGAGFTIARSVIGGNREGTDTTDVDCAGAATSGGYNVVGTSGCLASATSGDAVGDPGLFPLAHNGGQSDTHAIAKSSLPYRRVLSGCASHDQRAAPRSGRCDSGAYNLVFCLGTPVNRIGTGGDDDIVGTSGPDGFLALDGRDFIEGFGGADRICAGGGRDKIKGNGGADRISGGGGKDTLMGGGGNDRLSGGRGDDRLNGASGRDRCAGGAGRNTLISCER